MTHNTIYNNDWVNKTNFISENSSTIVIFGDGSNLNCLRICGTALSLAK